MVKDYDYHHNNPLHLFARAIALCKYMQSLVETSESPILESDFYPIKVYRAINLPDFVDDILVEPVPFSTTWNMDFALGWTVDVCCVFEINVTFNTILPLSLPIVSEFSLNQEQEEVVLPPCRLVKKGQYLRTFQGKYITVIQCDAVRLSPMEMIDFYPKKYIKTLAHAMATDLNGWINHKLFEYYDYEGGEIIDRNSPVEW
jgi:hypothetical protein